jgi:hypothetical protein
MKHPEQSDVESDNHRPQNTRERGPTRWASNVSRLGTKGIDTLLLALLGALLFWSGGRTPIGAHLVLLLSLVAAIALVRLALSRRVNAQQPWILAIFVAGAIMALSWGGVDSLRGVDTWTHNELLQKIIDKGQLPGAGEVLVPGARQYVAMPTFHLTIAGTIFATSGPVKIMGPVLMSILLFAAALSLSRLELPRLPARGRGTPAIFLLSAIGSHLAFLTWISPGPNLFALLIGVTILGPIWTRVGRVPVALAIMGAVTCILASAIGAAQLILLLTLLWTASALTQKPTTRTLGALTMTVAVSALLFWFIINIFLLRSFGSIWTSLFDSGLSLSNYSARAGSSITSRLQAQVALLSFLAVGGLAGLLIGVRKERRLEDPLLLVPAAFFLLSSIAFLNAGVAGIAHRFWAAAMLFGSPLVVFFAASRNHSTSKLLAAIMLLILGTIQASSGLLWDGNGLVDPSARYSLNATEHQLASYLSAVSPASVGSDQFFASRLQFFSPKTLVGLSAESPNQLKTPIVAVRGSAWGSEPTLWLSATGVPAPRFLEPAEWPQSVTDSWATAIYDGGEIRHSENNCQDPSTRPGIGLVGI